MKYKLGLKLGSKDIQYTDEILQYYEQGVFQYIEKRTNGVYQRTS